MAPRHIDLRPFVLTADDQRADGAGRADPRRAARGLAGGEFLAGRRHQGHLGTGIGTLGRGEGYHFLQLGAFVERAEWAIRLLDIAGSEGDDTETREQAAVDYFRWSALLQSLSAFETYRRLYRGAVNAAGVVDLMLLQAGNPRSLLTCATTAHNVLQTLSGDDSLEVVRQAGALSAHCRYARIDEILQQGLEPWLQAAMARLDRLGNAIHRQFMVSTDVATPVMAARPWSHEQ
jgi:uncharacterized alpha-E superfamily protein